jgi:hypothetical protein
MNWYIRPQGQNANFVTGLSRRQYSVQVVSTLHDPFRRQIDGFDKEEMAFYSVRNSRRTTAGPSTPATGCPTQNTARPAPTSNRSAPRPPPSENGTPQGSQYSGSSYRPSTGPSAGHSARPSAGYLP